MPPGRGALQLIPIPFLFHFAALTGKRTYLIALLAIGYLIYCQVTKQTPDETILGLFGRSGSPRSGPA